jgi:hypothetical protein
MVMLLRKSTRPVEKVNTDGKRRFRGGETQGKRAAASAFMYGKFGRC